MCYEFLVGAPPFECKDEENSQQETFERIRNIQFEFPDHVSDLARDLITKVKNLNEKEKEINHFFVFCFLFVKVVGL